MREVPVFLSSNKQKAAEVQSLLGWHVDLQDPAKYRTSTNNSSIKATDFVSHVVGIVGRPVIMEDTTVQIGKQYFPTGTEISSEILQRNIGRRLNVSLNVYVSTEPGEIFVFPGKLSGVIVPKRTRNNSEKKDMAFGWDDWFVPDGYTSTVGELGAQKVVVNFRVGAYSKVAQLLSGRPAKSIYETHLTVVDENKLGQERFKQDCTDLGVKAILIELQSGTPVNGVHQYQTGSWYAEDFKKVLERLNQLGQEFIKRGWQVVRSKVEVTPNMRDGAINCPIDDSDVVKYPETNYFEFHAKVEIPHKLAKTIEETLKSLCKMHGAHLSKNAFKKFDMVEHRFVTFRLYRVGQKTAYAKVDAFINDALKQGLKIIQVQREYAVWDSNVQFDHGWINTTPLNTTLMSKL